jgi:hypothetical protein
VIATAKQLAIGAFAGLDGLASMTPKGEFLSRLNATPAIQGRYFAIASNFEPQDHALVRWAKDAVLDAVFDGDANDLVVPTDGVFAPNGAAAFPIAEPLVFPTSDGVDHSSYLRNPRTIEAIKVWLRVEEGRSP